VSAAELFERVPPNDLGAEQATLGSMLLSPGVSADVLALLRSSLEFYRPAHQHVFEVIAALTDAGKPGDAITVRDELARRGLLSKVGGAPYLHTLIQAVPSAANGLYYARIVAEYAIKRRMIENGTRIVQLGYSGDGDAYELAARAISEAEAIAPPRADANVRDAQEIADSTVGSLERSEWGLPLPWHDINEGLCGLRPGQLIILAARPSVGKSIMGGQLAAYVAVRLGLPVLLCSLEMRAEAIMTRLIAAQAPVLLHSLQSRRLDQNDWDRILAAHKLLAPAPLVIDDTSMCTLSSIRASLRQMQRERRPARLLVVDYLQLMAGAGEGVDNRTQFVGSLSTGLKRIGREFNLPVVAIASLNRNAEHRSDKKPQMADLRDSGQVESDADVVLLLHREDVHDWASPRAGEIDVICAKNREGPTFQVTLAWQGHYGRAVDLSRILEPENSTWNDDWGSGFGPYREGGNAA
jgi:replicative DNA helicase